MVHEAYEESVTKGKALVNEVKFAIIAHEGGPALQRMYPEWFVLHDADGNEVVQQDEITEEDLDDSEGIWDFTQSDMGPTDIEDVLKQMGQSVVVDEVTTEQWRARTPMPAQPVMPDEEGWI